ncbi:hypothetical protein ERD78_18720 [Allopusillimonas soli]|uniref:Helix-turn-helix domain-containing protein n=1 Tax=Allopusillimonas soli TaxID=659016 RepID=A0A853FGA0_9BURK|nr:helix-turn-helix domain-containing protein [Allopusillimonas soli]NYT38899.1 helix-turn-helix domain-containing protein [Allopusillimonas soli]TEA70102.1 hypothetical protein ERD78_18720 [Allopusillimonas soli]
MLKGKDFGKAIEQAIRLKIESGGARSQAEIARHFGVKPPSVSDWIKKGAIAKERLPELWRYFADVVGADHWGMSDEEWPYGLKQHGDSKRQKHSHVPTKSETWPLFKVTIERLQALTPQQRKRADAAIDDLLRGYEAERGESVGDARRQKFSAKS